MRARVQVGFAKGDRTLLGAGGRSSIPILLRFAALVLWARLRGDHKASPFFDAQTGRPRGLPGVLSESQLREVERARDSTEGSSTPE